MSAGATPWLDNVDRMMGETSDEKVADERVWEWLSPWLSTDDAELIVPWCTGSTPPSPTRCGLVECSRPATLHTTSTRARLRP